MFCQVLHDVVIEIVIDDDFRMKSVGLMIFRSCLHAIRFGLARALRFQTEEDTSSRHFPIVFL